MLNLDLPEFEKCQPYIDAAAHGAFRVIHEEFCIISDFPQELHVDENNLPHCEFGPSHKWSDGFSIYHWRGVRIPADWIENRDALTAEKVLANENVEQRAAGISIIGMSKMLDQLDHKIIDSSTNPQVGDLIEITIPDLPESEFYLKFLCPRNGEMMEPVNKRELAKPDLHHAHAWHAGIPPQLYTNPQHRS